jgi:hypothetical protein
MYPLRMSSVPKMRAEEMERLETMDTKHDLDTIEKLKVLM